MTVTYRESSKMNTITLNSPTGRSTFHATLDKEMQRIVITNRSKREHYYHLDAINDLYLWLKNTMNKEWVYLGSKNEEELPNQGTVEEWARSPNNPRGGFYGITSGRRGRFATFVPPILELMKLVEVERNPKNNRIRAL
jgi:hypothetical protein